MLKSESPGYVSATFFFFGNEVFADAIAYDAVIRVGPNPIWLV